MKSFEERLEYMRGLTHDEWDKICRGCGLCCLCKYYTHDGGVEYASVACKNLDLKTRRCKCYDCRLKRGACHNVDIDIVRQARVLPRSCAYVEMLYGPPSAEASGGRPAVDWGTVLSENEISPLVAQKRIIPGSVNWSKLKS